MGTLVTDDVARNFRRLREKLRESERARIKAEAERDQERREKLLVQDTLAFVLKGEGAP